MRTFNLTVTAVSHRVGGYMIRARLANEVVADFEVFSLAAMQEGAALYQRKGSSSALDNPTSNLDEAETIANGSVKFDGCTNFVIEEGDDTMAHTCSVAQFRELLDAVARAHKLAASLLAHDAPVNEEYSKL